MLLSSIFHKWINAVTFVLLIFHSLRSEIEFGTKLTALVYTPIFENYRINLIGFSVIFYEKNEITVIFNEKNMVIVFLDLLVVSCRKLQQPQTYILQLY